MFEQTRRLSPPAAAEGQAVPYNLACYCAQLGRLEESQAWFKQTMALDKQTIKRAALDDPDPKPLWDSMWTQTD